MADSNKKGTVGIIGSGPGGLSCALLLNHVGLDVTIFERKSTPGGRTCVIDSGKGFKHDLGPTFFHYPQVLERISQTCGLEIEKEIPMKKLDPIYSLFFEGGQAVNCTFDKVKMQEQLKQFPNGGKESLGTS